MSKIEVPTYRYQVRPLNNGVEAEVAPAPRSSTVIFMTFFGVTTLGAGISLFVFVDEAGIGGAVIMILMAGWDFFFLSWLLYGYERLRIDESTLTFDWQMKCIRRVKCYALKDMGRIEKTVTTWDDEGTTRTSTQWAFQYGGKKIPFMPNLSIDEIPLLLRDIDKYLPEHIKPVNNTVTPAS